MKRNIVQEKSMGFAVFIVNICKSLQQDHEYIMSKQLLKSGTSIGANIYEAQKAESNADFVHKLSISLKEANESMYWIELLFRTKYIDEDIYYNANTKANELVALLTSIIKSSRKNKECRIKNSECRIKNAEFRM